MSKREPTKREVAEAIGWMVNGAADDFGEGEDGHGLTGCTADYWWSGFAQTGDAEFRITTERGDHFLLTISKPRKGKGR